MTSAKDYCSMLREVHWTSRNMHCMTCAIWLASMWSHEKSNNCPDEHGTTPLMIAAYEGNYRAVMYYKNMINVSATNIDGHTAEMFALFGRAQLSHLFNNRCFELCFLGSTRNKLTFEDLSRRYQEYDQIIDALLEVSGNHTDVTPDIYHHLTVDFDDLHLRSALDHCKCSEILF